MISTTYSNFTSHESRLTAILRFFCESICFPHDNYLTLFPSRGSALVTIVTRRVQTVGLSAAWGEEAQNEWILWEMVGAAHEMGT